jgi:hypothetical protein
MQRLQRSGMACAAIDITVIGTSDITPEQWYAGVIDSIVSSLNLYDSFDLNTWWCESALLSYVQRLSKFIEDILLASTLQNIVIFVDEIDSILSLKFNLDDFLALIRDCYNKRADNPKYRRLTFAIIGVATPSDLIQDKRRTPFNIGRAIELTGFQLQEAQPLALGLEKKVSNPQQVLQEILAWTGGQPFLTQKVCQLVLQEVEMNPLLTPCAQGEGAERIKSQVAEWVANLVQKRIIENWEAQDEPEHLRTIRDRILYSSQHKNQLLQLYRQILQTSFAPPCQSRSSYEEVGGVKAANEPEQLELRLTGLAVKQQGKLRVYNRIYASVFNKSWIDAQSPLSFSLEEQGRQIPLNSSIELQTQVAPETQELKSSSRLSRQEFRNRQILLNKVRNYWIKGVLETSLQGRIQIELGLEERLDAVVCPWSLSWEHVDIRAPVSEGDASFTAIPQGRSHQLPPDTRLIDKFDEIGAGRTLLILGEPGSGKTITLLELTKDLIERTQMDLTQPIPAIFNLSSWSSHKQTLAQQNSAAAFVNWLVQELHIKYQVSPEIGQIWIKEQQLLLLLDGLDEVSTKHRQGCVEALNHFNQDYGQTEIVVCSRIKDYQALSTRLRFQCAIYLQPLTPEQIKRYLTSAGSKLAALRTALLTSSTLQELAQSPLMLNIMTLAYQDIAIEELPTQNVGELCQHLFNAYTQRMFDRRGTNSCYSKDQSQRWLIWLAKRMVQESQTVFLIERMQPRFLEAKVQQWLYASGLSLIGALIVGLVSSLNIGQIFGLSAGLKTGLALGMSGGLIYGLIIVFIMKEIEPVSTLKWSWKKAKENLIPGLRIGIIVSLFMQLIFVPFLAQPYQLAVGWLDTLSYGISGLGTGLIFILLRGLTGSGIETSTSPNQGIWQSAKNTMVFILIGV